LNFQKVNPMKPASIQQIKAQIATIPIADLRLLCMRLAKFKKENKELLTYLLFEADDEDNYVLEIKTEIDELFETVSTTSSYFAKKTLQKIARLIDKYVRYSGEKQTEIAIRIHFCNKILNSITPFMHAPVIKNLYLRQLKKIKDALGTLHEDLQYDYQQEVENLEQYV